MRDAPVAMLWWKYAPCTDGSYHACCCRVLFSPHAENVLASCSYDMTVRLWDVAAPEDALLKVYIVLYLCSPRHPFKVYLPGIWLYNEDTSWNLRYLF